MVLNASKELRGRAADWMALPMFCLSLTFLILVAISLVLMVEVWMMMPPPEIASGEAAAQPAVTVVPWISVDNAFDSGTDCIAILLAIWPVFWLELAFQFAVRDRAVPFWRRRYMSVIGCICPPLRMCTRNFDRDGKIWFPSMGWSPVDDDLREQLDKAFSVPMILIALTILPVLLIDFGMKSQVMTRPWLQIILHVSTGVIWFAFAAEFIVMVSVAEKKLKYCKSHWIDLAIILIPFISFLRSLRVVRATRLARVAKIQQLSRMGRLYRLRGLALRAVRGLMILELLNRVFRIGPERQLKKLRTVLEEKEKELEVLRRQIVKLEKQVEEKRQTEPATVERSQVEADGTQS